MLLLMIICWHLGVKRTKFTIKAFGDDMGHAERTDATAEKEKGEEKGEVEDVDKEELDPEVKMGPVAGKAIIGRWKWLIGEMVGVLVGGSVVVGVGSWFLYTTTFR
jgi:hypothetical protein